MKRRGFLSALAAWGFTPSSGCRRPAGPPAARPVLAEDIGIKTLAGFSPLIRAGAELPATFVDDFSTAEDGQDSVSLELYTRDSQRGDVRSIGEFAIHGIERAARGVPKVEVVVTVVESGLVVVTARHRTTGQSQRAELGPVRLRDG